MTAGKRVLFFLGALYAGQVAAALYCHFCPFADREKDGKRYVARHGGPLPDTLLPGFGALQFIWVDLTIYDRSGKIIGGKGVDIPLDVYEAYPEVWPEMVRKRT